VNRAVHATAAQQSCVGGVDDGIDVLLRDVALNGFDLRGRHFAPNFTAST
jgi:hypothetical protein